MGVDTRNTFHVLEKLFGREIKGWFLLSLSNWELKFFKWWWQKRFSRVPRRGSSLEWSNFWSIFVNFVQKLSENFVLLSKVESQGFEKVRFLDKKCFFWNLTEKTLAIVVEIANYLCQAFLEQKQEAISFFGCRAKNLRLVLSNVLPNCPNSFVETIFAGLVFFSNCGLIFGDWFCQNYFLCVQRNNLKKKSFL